MENKNSFENERDLKLKYKNSRRMAWVGILVCAWLTFEVVRLGILKESLVFLLGFWSAIILGWMGVTNAREGWGKK